MKGVRISLYSYFPSRGDALFCIFIGRNKYISIFEERRGHQICNIYDDADQFVKDFIIYSAVAKSY
jgi:hypothetical protein